MNCIWISNNYGSTKDAIGRYTMKLVNAIQNSYKNISIKVFYGNTIDKSKIRRLYLMTMTNVILKAKKKIAI